MDNPDPKKVTPSDYLKPKNWLVIALLIKARFISFLPIKKGSYLASFNFLANADPIDPEAPIIKIFFEDMFLSI